MAEPRTDESSSSKERPGESVTAEVVRTDKRWSRARVVTVLEPSPDRVPVPCAHQLEGCGGCDLLHVTPDAN